MSEHVILQERLLDSVLKEASQIIEANGNGNGKAKTVPLGQWVLDNDIMVKTGEGDWRPFSFDGHEYLLQSYGLIRKDGQLVSDPQRLDLYPYDVIEKASQMGATVRAICRSLKVAMEQSRTVIYFFPTDTDVRDFSDDRFREMVYQTEYLQEQIGRVDNKHLVKIGQSTIYFRGMFSKTRTKSVPGDYVVFDELDEAEQKNKDQARQRLKHSNLRWVSELSTPSIPMFGVDIEFGRSDQRYWFLKCEHCSTWTCLEDEFLTGDPERVLIVTEKHPLGYRACKKCGRPLNLQRGQWVSKFPQNKERFGQHYSQLFSSVVTAYEILKEFRETNNITEFYNSTIGVPHIEKDAMLNMLGDLEGCKDMSIKWEDKTGELLMGADQGDVCHVKIEKVFDSSGGPQKIKTQHVHLEIIRDPDPFPRLGQLMEEYNISRAVIDALPNHVPAKKLVRDFLGRVYICHYIESDKLLRVGKEKESNAVPNIEDNFTVFVDRNQSLEAAALRYVKRLEVIPNPGQAPIVMEGRTGLNICKDIFYRHMTALARKMEVVDELTGKQKKKILHIGLDPHFAHANNYCNIALMLLQRIPRMDADFGEGPDSTFTEMVGQYKQALRVLRVRLKKEPTYQQVAQEMGLSEDEWDYIKMVEEYLNDVDLQQVEAVLNVPGLRDEDIGYLEEL